MAQDRGLDSLTVNFAMGNGYYGWCIPEFDDDQRLSDGAGGNEYGRIAHVLAAPWLDTLQFDGGFKQVAIMEVDPDTDTSTPPAPYTDLHLGRFNCLYLRRTSTTPTFDALISPPQTSLVCPSSPTAQPGPPLIVVVDSVSNNIQDYPATTRFIEGRNGKTLIGVRCGNRWCAVGPPNAVDAPSFAVGTRLPSSAHQGQPGYNTAQARVKGWFDDQVLGMPDLNSKHKIHRHVRASAVPNSNLGDLTVDQFKVANGVETYRPVGRVFFPEAPDPASKYVTVFGFSQGTNDIALRAEIHPGTGTGPQDTVWFTQVVNARGTRTNDIRTRRMEHRTYLSRVFGERFRIPGTMRWRWADGDEDLWIECDVGCCLAGIH